ncbi:MAG: methyl-accepting chemotaxis protein [Magnetococcales bacterium]|nr:methyl-accepting chemotaxis protein [Magnetococcales bacterium]
MSDTTPPRETSKGPNSPDTGTGQTTNPPIKQMPPNMPIVPAGRYRECGECSAMILSDFAKSFDKSARRWELIVYPSLFAFIILAMYGFFLIYSLTQDIRTMASSIDPKMGVNMGSLSNNIAMLSNNVELMSTHLEYISDNMETMSVDMQNMAENMENITDSVNAMNVSVSGMNQNVSTLNGSIKSMDKTMTDINQKMNALAPINQNVAVMGQAVHNMAGVMNSMGSDMNGATRPMSFINRFMPW